jgi:hypothetical protein
MRTRSSVLLKRHGLMGRGYLIIEMLFWLGLLGVFGLTAGRLFQSTFRVIHEASEETESVTRFDSAIKVLRDDLRSSTSCDEPDMHTLIAHSAQGDVRWKQDEQRDLVRSTGGAEQRWAIGQALEFQRDGALVLLRSGGDSAGDIALSVKEKQP